MNDLISRHGVSVWLENMGYPKLSKAIMDEKRFPFSQSDVPDPNVGDMNSLEQTIFKPGDKFILENGKRQQDEFEIAGTDYYIKIYLLKMFTPYNPEQNTETRVLVVGDLIRKQDVSDIDAIKAV